MNNLKLHIILLALLSVNGSGVYADDVYSDTQQETLYNQTMLQKYFSESIVSSLSPQAPTAAAFHRYGRHPVNMSNGLVPITIPLYEIQCGSLSVPIQLSYHGGGIKLREDATWVGLGWTLDFGGSITRTKNGHVDEEEDFTSVPDASEIHGQLSAKEQSARRMCYLWSEGKLSNYSFQPDLFSYQFGQHSGTFFYDETMDSIHTFSYEPIVVKHGRVGGGSGKAISSGRCTSYITPDGTRYGFDKSSCEKLRIADATHTIDQYESTYYISSIISADEADTIRYDYQKSGEYLQAFPSEYSGYSKNESEKLMSFGLNIDFFAKRLPVTNSGMSHYTRTIKPQTISFRGGRITFVLSEGLFEGDVNRECKKLDQIKIERQTAGGYELVKTIHFRYTRDVLSRLMLESIYETGVPGGINNVKELAAFEYYDDYSKGIDRKSCDYWGYYNGKYNADLVPRTYIGTFWVGHADRTPDEKYMKFSSLKKITYPTGGCTEFDWEINRAYGANMDEPLVSYSTTKSLSVAPASNVSCTDGVGSKPSYSRDEEDMGQTSSLTIKSVIDQSVTLQYSLKSKNPNKPVHQKYDRLRITVNGDIVESLPVATASKTGKKTLYMEKGKTYCVTLSANCSNLSGSLTIKYVDGTPAGNEVDGWKFAGLRIKEMNQYDMDGSLLERRHYEYKTPDGRCSGYLTTEEKKISHYKECTNTMLVNPESYNPNPNSSTSLALCPAFLLTYNHMISSDITRGPADNQLAYEYATETVYDGKSGKALSCKKYRFNKVMDIHRNLIAPMMSMAHLRGKELEVDEYKVEDGDYRLVRTTRNHYTTDERVNHKKKGFMVYCKYQGMACESDSAGFSLFQRDAEIASWTDVFLPMNYEYSSTWMYLDSRQTTEYSDDGTALEKTTRYQYGNPGHALPTVEEIWQGGDCFVVRSQYTGDLQDAIGLKMKSCNVTALPVSQKLYQKQTSGEVLQGGVQNEYDDSFLKTEVHRILPNGRLRRLYSYRYADVDRHHILTDFIGQDSIPTSFYWDKNDNYPLVVATGMTSDTLKSVMSSYTITEDLLRSLYKETPFRGISVKAYTYHSDFSLKSLTQPNGVTTFYEYDGLGRLSSVLNGRKQVMTKYFYNFAR